MTLPNPSDRNSSKTTWANSAVIPVRFSNPSNVGRRVVSSSSVSRQIDSGPLT